MRCAVIITATDDDTVGATVTVTLTVVLTVALCFIMMGLGGGGGVVMCEVTVGVPCEEVLW